MADISEVFVKFVEFKLLVVEQSCHFFKVIRSNNGGEYMSICFWIFLEAMGFNAILQIPTLDNKMDVLRGKINMLCKWLIV